MWIDQTGPVSDNSTMIGSMAFPCFWIQGERNALIDAGITSIAPLLEQEFGEGKVLIGIQRYQDTAKGEAMGVQDYFVKVIVEKETDKILGAHIIGPQASILIQEIIDLMYTKDQTFAPIKDGMHIHPALSEVVERAFGSLIPAKHYHHILEDHYKLPVK